MSCTNHPDAPARKKCFRCTIALCETCLAECIEIGPNIFCPACAPVVLHENIERAEKAREQAGRAVFVTSALMGIGIASALVAYLTGGDSGTAGATIAVVLFFSLSRLYSVWVEMQALRGTNATALSGQRLVYTFLPKFIAAIFLGAFTAPWATLRLMNIKKHAEGVIHNSRELLCEYAGKTSAP